jgi:hypothetical protein
MIYIFSFVILSIPFLLDLKRDRYVDLFIFLYLFLFISFPYSAGGDSMFYREKFENNFSEIGLGYFFGSLYLLFQILDLDYQLFKIFITFIFLYFGLNFFKKLKVNYYFIIPLLFPIFIIIYGMGSLRQGLALAFFFYFLSIKSPILRMVFFFLPATIHPSAIILNLLYLLFFFKKKIFKNLKKVNFFILLAIFCGLSIFLLFINLEYIKLYYINYIKERQLTSSGAILRCSITLFSAILFLNFKDKYKILESHFFTTISWIVIISYPFVFFYSTPVDRVYVYFYPLQFVTISILLQTIKNKNLKLLVMYTVLLFSFIYLNVWIFFSENFKYWENYNLFII